MPGRFQIALQVPPKPAAKTLRTLDYTMEPSDDSVLDLVPDFSPDLTTLAIQWCDGERRFSLPWKDSSYYLVFAILQTSPRSNPRSLHISHGSTDATGVKYALGGIQPRWMGMNYREQVVDGTRMELTQAKLGEANKHGSEYNANSDLDAEE
ncbi:hypothetical protein CPB83DRAFT_885305 [Crepidotus variabilis]|uniref:Uncharacterized protein n=1 Tax=Crepidotus variabilis TaxID=179855 RepID=A0A9P6JM89_9AGAR|nr:hypothetical protein CPB83DRAFT_885305 [Crepidotus variabilis]